MPDQSFDWAALTPDIASGLAAAGTGTAHLLGVGQRCYDKAAKAPAYAWLFGLGFDVQLQAWALSPCDAAIAGHLLALDARLSRLSPDLSAILEYVCAHAAEPQGAAYVARLHRLGEREKLRTMIGRGIATEGGNLFWWAQARQAAIEDADWDWLLALPEPDDGDVIGAALRRFARADVALLAGNDDAALTAYAALPWPGLELRRGECLLRMGRRDEALALWRDTVRARPWDVTLLMRLHAEETGSASRLCAPQGRTAVLLYTWNKAESLRRTLDSLARTDLCGAQVVILDNGSTDATPGVIASAVGSLGTQGVTLLRAPVNVGAPAARNWLLHSPELADCEFLVYLDDDVRLPRDWLRRLGAGSELHPAASAWGCRVVCADAPHHVQHADMHILPAPAAQQLDLVPGTATFALSRPFAEEPDFGQFAYVRPCTSVTGCCHMFRRETLVSAGGFDLQFSPSQFDDLDLDLRLGRMGGYAVYQGHLRVAHEQGTAAAVFSRSGEMPYGPAGNIYKLYRKHAMTDMDLLRGQMLAVVLDDIAARRAALGL
ncbi:hypothetical protein GGQ74_001623 [Desulfobaculum xiamenense]|uniref:Glycosyltransferase 2-like domain-containing protein n=1 Tax=Desulfobaculum xiamenense TaxID=995050 RepID=A0A846QLP5_9BACT|nr:glycosyltransferase family 2 protein [Desulfobaculum xiamenense]NJB67950.1 hypothetical protein [Desulfobaculum xiamenense]